MTQPSRQPLISLIAAMDENRVIGIDNRLPWKLPADLQYFRQVTMGKPILMGRKTYESIGRPLPGRVNIVLTSDPAFTADGCTVVHSVEEALGAAGGSEEVMVIGGASLYRHMLPIAHRIYMTLVHARFEGDTQFPVIEPDEWREAEREDHAADERNVYRYSFVRYERRS
ncbi:MAG: type 3 dihydrofolate reductase [Gammaproteobacteria bacterium]